MIKTFPRIKGPSKQLLSKNKTLHNAEINARQMIRRKDPR